MNRDPYLLDNSYAHISVKNKKRWAAESIDPAEKAYIAFKKVVINNACEGQFNTPYHRDVINTFWDIKFLKYPSRKAKKLWLALSEKYGVYEDTSNYWVYRSHDERHYQIVIVPTMPVAVTPGAADV